MTKFLVTKRDLIHVIATTFAPAVLAPAIITRTAFAEENKKDEQSDAAEEVSPPEDLMREHGVLDRVLLILRCGNQTPFDQ